MQDLFKSYIGYTEKDIQELWKEATFAFDTNVLLNLYRYSKKTSDEVVDILKNIKTRVFIPYHVGFEFHKKRISVLLDQIKQHDEFLKSIKEVRGKLENPNEVPHLSDELSGEAKTVFDKISSEIDLAKEKFQGFRHGIDPVLKEIYEIFDGKVGDPYTSIKLTEIYNEGKKRFEKKIPPGYLDNTKEKEKADNVYGDYIIWLQLIDKAKSTGKPIIFISEDQKEDWYLKTDSGSTIIGMRPELKIEMLTEANVNFQIYTINQFVKYAKEYLKLSIGKEALEEIEKASKKANKRTDAKMIGDHVAKKYLVRFRFNPDINSNKLDIVGTAVQAFFNIIEGPIIYQNPTTNAYMMEVQVKDITEVEKIEEFIEDAGLEVEFTSVSYLY